MSRHLEVMRLLTYNRIQGGVRLCPLCICMVPFLHPGMVERLGELLRHAAQHLRPDLTCQARRWQASLLKFGHLRQLIIDLLF